MSESTEIIAGQSISIEPEQFQARLIERISSTLSHSSSPPCLLRAPTGAGKTFIIGRVLEEVSDSTPTIWFWFVPYVTLVQQTEDSIASNCLTMAPTSLSRGRNKEPVSGMVLISTAQGVAKATARKTGYRSDADDDVRSLADLVDRGRAKGLKIGLVVDEAHIGLDSQTEFGQFAKWLCPDLLIMASATPKDQRLVDFLASAGFGGFESFTVSRDEVVNARLNKKYIEAVVYDLRQSMRTITDLQQTVLKQGWRRNLRIKKLLQAQGIPVVPLLLVQVANGATTVEEARRHLVTLCKVPPHAIGEHSADEPNPVLMAAIANDTTKEVLIFKQSAGTGFDAPRAFVLASTKPVNDADFALQFIGRVMRVTRGVRNAFPRPGVIDPELDTAFIYLANAQAQQGFEQAVQTTSQLRSQLEGQTEKLVAQQMASGAVVYRNRDSDQPPLIYDTELPILGTGETPNTPAGSFEAATAPLKLAEGLPGDLFAADDALDVPVTPLVQAAGKPKQPKKREEFVAALQSAGIRVYTRTGRGKEAPPAFKRERRPEMADMSAISRAAAAKLSIGEELKANAVRAALDRVREREIHTELTSGTRSEEEVAVVTDRTALAKEALALLRALPQVEDEDARIIIEVLTKRLHPAVNEQFEDADEEARPSDAELQRRARDAAYWVVRREADALAELLYFEIAAQSVLEDAARLPDFMTFPIEIGLESSARNLFGVLPPSSNDLEQVAQVMTVDKRELVARDHDISLDDGALLSGAYDGSSVLNNEEREFAKALDRASFVRWWHRNPDRKPYSVRLVRGEHKNYFYPDFVVCLEHFPGDNPAERLVETKENVKDAARKSKHVPEHYGQVLFLTKDQKRLRVVNTDGSLGDGVDLDDLVKVREWLRASRPVVAQ
jgi:type III restriction enzyme